MGMDLPLQKLRRSENGHDAAVRSSSEPGPVESFGRAEEELFRVAPLEVVEDHLHKLQTLMTKLALKGRERRQSELAERCAICGNLWKLRLPDGSKVPHGLCLWHMPDKTTMNLYACDAACYSKLQYEVEKRTFQLRVARDDEATKDREDYIKRLRKL
jgi:hypothetical protein